MMTSLRISRRVLLLLIAALGLLPAVVRADQNDPQLPALFARLKAASDQSSALEIQDEIWKVWYLHKNHHIQDLLVEASEAMEDGDQDRALELANQVIEKAPKFAEAWNLRATLYYNMGSYLASLSDIEQTLKLEPRHFGALAGRGLCYLALDEEDKALVAFEAALKLHPWMPSARTNVELLRRSPRSRSLEQTI
jgi:tetratricopeptide (TPR) repeat protein